MKKSKLLNKCIAVLLTTSISSPVALQPTYGIDTKSISSSIELKLSNAEEWIKDNLELSGLVTFGILCAGYVSGYMLRVASWTMRDKALLKKYVENFNKTFKNNDVKKNEHTCIQEGATWSWLACIQAMLKEADSGSLKSQKEIYTKMFGVKPTWFKATRYSRFNFVDDDIRNAIGDMSGGKSKLNRYLVYVDTEHSKEERVKIVGRIKQTIIDYYHSTGKKIFSIRDSFNNEIWRDSSIPFNFVNIVDIDENNNNTMTIEDPQSGLSRKETIDDFCKRYFCRDGILTKSPVIEMMSIVDSNNHLPNYCYSIDENNVLNSDNSLQ